MSNYSDQEIESAVSKFVRREVKTEREDLGQLNVEHAFTEVKEFVASTLIYDPGAIFYLLSLAANRVNQDVIQALIYVDDIKTAIQEMGRYTIKVTKTALLEDAAAALLEVDRLLDDKNTIADQGLARYKSSLAGFTKASLIPNIRDETALGFPDVYKVVRPPQKAQAAIKATIVLLREIHNIILEEAKQLSEAMSEFMAVNLPLLVIQSSVGKIRTDLRKLKKEFDDTKTDDDAISLTRDAYLRIAAGESVITNLSTISDPREPRMQGLTTTSDRAQAACGNESESLAACVITSKSAPWALTPTAKQIVLAVNGGGDNTINLPVDNVADIIGSVYEPYDIHEAQKANLTSLLTGPYVVTGVPNNVFDVYIDGIGFRVILTPGLSTTDALAIAINGALRIDGSPGTFGDEATASNASNYLRFEHDTAGEKDIVIGDQDVLNAALGFASGQDSDDLAGTRGIIANNKIKFLVDDDIGVEATLTVGVTRTAAQVAVDISAASPSIDAGAVAIEVLPSGTKNVVGVESTSYGAGSAITPYPTMPVHEEVMKTLGFYEIQSDRAGYTDLNEVVGAIESVVPLLIKVERSETLGQNGAGGKARKVGADYVLEVGAVGTIIVTKVAVGDTLQIELGENVGWYRVEALVTLDGGTKDGIRVERAFPTVTGTGAENQRWSVYQRHVQPKTKLADLSSRIEVKAGSANSILGLTIGTYCGYVSGVKVLDAGKVQSFQRHDVHVGDQLTLGSGGSASIHQVTALTESGYQIEVTPQVRNDTVNQLYRIDSEGGIAYNSFIAEIGSWLNNVGSGKFSENILYLERKLNPLLANKNPSDVLIKDAEGAATDLEVVYSGSGSGLKEILEDFTITPVVRMDALLDMLVERGLDRAHDMLLLGQVGNFFGLTKDSSSYSGNMLETMRAVAQQDLPLSRGEDEDHTDSRLIGSADEPDADLDFSDQDDETGITEIDDIPDPDEEDFLSGSV